MDIVIRAALAFTFIFILTRVVGRRELNSLEPCNRVLTTTYTTCTRQ